jgi:hypothetical protein
MRLQLSVAAALCVFSLAAHADTVYNYVGPDFQYFDGAYTATDNVTGSFTVANPIPPDYSGLVYTSAFSFNDGVQTISNANGHFINFNITTDANGNITYYMIRVTAADPLTFILLENQNTAFGDYGANFVYDEGTDNDPALGGASVYLPGEFTEVPAINSTPEPSSFALLGTGLLGVVSVLRKRFA